MSPFVYQVDDLGSKGIKEKFFFNTNVGRSNFLMDSENECGDPNK